MTNPNIILRVPPRLTYLAQMEAIYGSMHAPDVVAHRHGFKNWDAMYVAFLFAWELHLFLEYVTS